MAFLIYHTKAIVLDYMNVGEADRIFTVFSKDFGMLRVYARGIRYGKSKLAPHTPLFSQSRIAFVSGKDIFRLIDAEEHLRPRFSNSAFVLAGRMSSLTVRLVRGQEPDASLWTLLSSAFLFLHEASISHILSKKQLSFFSLLFGVRLLWRLGYVDRQVVSLASLFDLSWQEALHQSDKYGELKVLLEKGIRTSQL